MKDNMKKAINLIIIMVVLSTFCYAYVKLEVYRDMGIKYYGNVNRTLCENILDKIPTNYTNGISYMKIMNTKVTGRLGQYWIGTRGIDIFDGCHDEDVILHELAHDCQMEMYNDFFWEAVAHEGNFEICYDEIWKEYQTKDILMGEGK